MEDGFISFCLLIVILSLVVGIVTSLKSYNILSAIPFYEVSDTEKTIEGYTVIIGEPESKDKDIRRYIHTKDKTWEIQKDGTWKECCPREHKTITEKLKAWLEMNAVQQVVNQQDDNKE